MKIARNYVKKWKYCASDCHHQKKGSSPFSFASAATPSHKVAPPRIRSAANRRRHKKGNAPSHTLGGKSSAGRSWH